MVHNKRDSSRAILKDVERIAPRVIRTPQKIFRIICMATALCVVNISLASAIETTKASALLDRNVVEKKQRILSLTPHSSPVSRNDKKENPCLSFLSVTSVPPKHGSKDRYDVGRQPRAGNATVPVALGLFLGARLALIPSQAPQKDRALSHRLQIGPEIRGISRHGNSHALAVAAYRKCQKQEFLKAGYNNK